MKNIQVIDGADNCKYRVFAATESEFELIFPNGADLEFIEDFLDRVGEELGSEIMDAISTRPIEKEDVKGIHGTLFYELINVKKKFYPNKRFSDDKRGG
ncbi:MAG: hypothetical protein JO273_04380 [Methylobacteriaceae bacterium]|nr:hypothetical protein [Methylobacteriaceae bacterium]